MPQKFVNHLSDLTGIGVPLAVEESSIRYKCEIVAKPLENYDFNSDSKDTPLSLQQSKVIIKRLLARHKKCLYFFHLDNHNLVFKHISRIKIEKFNQSFCDLHSQNHYV